MRLKARLQQLVVTIVGELRVLESECLEASFGRFGRRLFELARGVDEREVESNRPTQSISAEDTVERDVRLEETEPIIRRLAEKVWTAALKERRQARTVVLKLKTDEFKLLTCSMTPATFPATNGELAGLALRERVGLDP